MISQDELEGLVAFYRRGSTYDILQARTANGWSCPWTFTACDIHAAEKAAWMMRRMGAYQVRHARRARLRINGGDSVETILVTVLPGRDQTVIGLDSGCARHLSRIIGDACLDAIEAALMVSQRW